MTTQNLETTNGGKPPGEEIGADIMSEVAQNLGQKAPAAAAEGGEGGGDENAGGEGGEQETEEQKAERLANETPEEKAAREKEEAAAADGGQGDEETEEQKAERLANETPEEKTAREAEEAAAAADDGKEVGKTEKADAAKVVEAKLKDLEPDVRKRVQGVINEVVGRIVAKERGETERLGTRVTELTTELETAQKANGPTIIGGVNPLFMVDDETAISEREEKIEAFERWAAKNANGSNLPDSEGYDESKPSHTADQIEARLTEVLQEKKKILPAARANLTKRAEIDKVLRDVYPAVFDPKTPEYAQIQQVVKVLPELKQFADWRVIALKQVLGDRALADFLAKKKEQKPTGQNGKKPGEKLPRKTPPKAPGGGSSAKGSVLDPKGKQSTAPAALKTVMKDPSNKAAFKAAVGALVADI